MSIQSQIQRLTANIASAYAAAAAKNAEMPKLQNSDNLAAAIESIELGSTPIEYPHAEDYTF